MSDSIYIYIHQKYNIYKKAGRHGHDSMVVGFTTTYAISAYHHWCCKFESRSGQGVQHYVVKYISDLRQVGGFTTNKTDRHQTIYK
jgi:hypothetical protein